MTNSGDQNCKDADDYKKVVGLMSQHLVTLVCYYDTIEKDGRVSSRNNKVFSGWLLELHGRLFWVTAGHCLSEINDHIEAGHIRVTAGAFMDYLGYRAEFIHTVPFTYAVDSGFHIWDPEIGMDFAIIPLADLYGELFAKNNNVPITRINWIHQHRLTFDFYRILGVPEDRVFETARPDGTTIISVQPTWIAVNRILFEDALRAPTKPLPKSKEWFFGRLDPGTGNQTVVGMSGGPIFGFRKSDAGDVLYHVVALQSWWDKDKRIVFGCSVPFFAEKVYEAMQWHPGDDHQ